MNCLGEIENMKNYHRPFIAESAVQRKLAKVSRNPPSEEQPWKGHLQNLGRIDCQKNNLAPVSSKAEKLDRN